MPLSHGSVRFLGHRTTIIITTTKVAALRKALGTVCPHEDLPSKVAGALSNLASATSSCFLVMAAHLPSYLGAYGHFTQKPTMVFGTWSQTQDVAHVADGLDGVT